MCVAASASATPAVAARGAAVRRNWCKTPSVLDPRAAIARAPDIPR